MATLTGFQKCLGLKVWGKIGKAGDPDPLNINGIYRRRPGPRGITVVKMNFYDPGPPTHQGQLDAQDKFAAAVLAWQGLTSAQKEVYNKRVAWRQMYGYNLFLREYMLT